jgi:hypothetical protein
MPMPKTNLPNARVDFMYYEKGMSCDAIGAVLGCSGNTIRSNLKERGKKLRPRGRHVVRTINLSGDWRKQLNSYLRKSK